MKKKFTFVIMFMIATFSLMSQESTKTEVSAGVDFYNRYVWRGLLFTDAPSIQPYITASKGGFSATLWGSYATSKNYAEIDLFLSYTAGNYTIGLSDYYTEDETDLTMNDYTDFEQGETPHLIETYISYQLPVEKFPLTITGSTFVYGADLDANGDQNFSSYFELMYPFTAGDYDLSITMGGTVDEGYYGDKAGIVNLSLGASRSIKITESFSIPLNTAFIVNPLAKDLFFVVGISL
ncbi:hypothetical protein [Plebeiibacterium sediminum]|uniref:Uncharacterized protein n=1 Tax=Plebeiibacterium sediminum TaxID=2992112 RepID=A0AAE3SEM0_9BACT|nr:hypothetical protein [Plebeiobacterium sediminum]MCW3786628.1 hypothetical protein [Plebeiobacterium sediminum]